MAISDEGDGSDVSKPNYFGKDYISPKANLEVFLKPPTTVLTHPIALVSIRVDDSKRKTPSNILRRSSGR